MQKINNYGKIGKEEILAADGAVLPGVGSFGDTVDTMNAYGIKETVKEYIAGGKPFLGICLGMQLLFPESEESPGAEGLGIFEGTITKIPNGDGLKIPHMGWNSLTINPQSRLLKGIGEEPYVYFVHSYYLTAKDRDLVAARTEYGVTIDDTIIEQIIRTGKADISQRYLDTTRTVISVYCNRIFETLQKYEYDPDLMRLFIVGGGARVIRGFGKYDADRVTIVDDICAAAKGFEYLASLQLAKR